MRRDPRAAWGRLSAVLMPLVDLVMLLVLFFALAQGVIQNPLVEVALPEAREGREAGPPGVERVVSVDRAGGVYLDGARLDTVELAAFLTPQAQVHVRADGGTPYATVRGVLDALRDQGILNVRLAVLPEEHAAP